MPDPQDLVTLAQCSAYLAAGGLTPNAAQTAVLPDLITAASYQLCRFCRRYFALAAYDEILDPVPGQPDKGQPDFLDLRYLPVRSVSRVAGGRTTALTVLNTSTTTNQRATVAPTFTGDTEITTTLTGLTLTTVASGVVSAPTVPWTTTSPFTSIHAIAALINALGNGWLATVTPTMSAFAAADLVADLTPAGALGGSGAELDVFADDLDVVSDVRTGAIFLPFSGSGGGRGTAADWLRSADLTTGGAAWRGPVRVTYTAGWAVIPPPVQRACSELVKATLDRLATDGSIKQEKAHDYSYEVRDVWHTLPPWVAQTMAAYRVLT